MEPRPAMTRSTSEESRSPSAAPVSAVSGFPPRNAAASSERWRAATAPSAARALWMQPFSTTALTARLILEIVTWCRSPILSNALISCSVGRGGGSAEWPRRSRARSCPCRARARVRGWCAPRRGCSSPRPRRRARAGRRVDVARGGRGADAAAERAAVADLRAADLAARHGECGKILPHNGGLCDLRMHAHRADGERIAGQFNLLELLHLRQAQNSVRVPDLAVALSQKSVHPATMEPPERDARAEASSSRFVG